MTLRNILHIVSNIDDEASGPSYSVPSLSNALSDLGCNSDIVSTTFNSREVGSHQGGIIKFPIDKHPKFFAERMFMSRALFKFIKNNGHKYDVIHIHGLWLAPNLYPFLLKKPGMKLVVSPRGMLDPAALSISRSKKFFAWHFYQKHVLRMTDIFHATSEREAKHIRKFFKQSNIITLPNGIEIPNDRGSVSKDNTFLYIGRIHPKKGLSLLLDAWFQFSKTCDDWNLVICGPDEVGELERLKRKIEKLRLNRVSLLSPKYGQEKWDLYRRAKVFVMPTFGENFGMTVAESLSVGTPCICSTGAPWSGLIDNKCGWWIERDVDSFVDAMMSAVNLSDAEMKTMGENGLTWMNQEFNWRNIARKMLQEYSSDD